MRACVVLMLPLKCHELSTEAVLHACVCGAHVATEVPWEDPGARMAKARAR